MTDDQTTFGTFGWGHGAPKLERKRPVYIHADRKRLVGFVCRDRGRGMTAYSSRRKPYHYYRKEDAYAISEDVISYLDEIGVSRILIHEHRDEGESPGDVYEYTTRAYRNADTVGEDWPFKYGDKQRFVPVCEAMNHWPGYAGHLFAYDWNEMWDRIKRR